jgi:branched-chain amino acid transport system substrate-binding protein
MRASLNRNLGGGAIVCFLALLIPYLLAGSAFAQQQESRVALVIGNGAYKSSPLKNPVNDSKDVAAKLRSLGFTVVERNNLVVKQIGSTLREFRSTLKPGSVALVYYAGHGVQIKGENYLPAVDAEIGGEEDVPNQSLAMRQIMDVLGDAKTRLNLVFLDACRDNPYARSFRSSASGLSKENAPSGTLISFATRPGSVALDGTGRNGLYTGALLAAMNEPNRPIEQVLKSVVSTVKAASKNQQEPWMEGSIEGEFCFSGCNPIAVTQNTAPEMSDAQREEKFWDEAKAIGNREAFEAYLGSYPTGRYAALAKAASARLLNPSQQVTSAPNSAVMPPQQGSNTAAATQEVLVKIGHAAPLTGNQAHLGRENENGARMAIADLNQQKLKIGGQEAKFQLISEDDGADPRRGTFAAQKLVDAKVAGVVGHMNSGTTIPASRIYFEAGIPQISPSATNPRYTTQGHKTAFRLIANDTQLGAILGRYAVIGLRGKAIAIIDDRTAYGQGIADAFEKSVIAAGGKLIGREYTNDRATDFTSILTTLSQKWSKPDIVFFGGMDTVAGPIIRQMNQFGINAKFLGGDGICTNELAKLSGDAMGDDQVVCAEAGGVTATQEKRLDDFKARFLQKYNSQVQIYAPYVYDAMMVMAAAMQKANSTDPAKYLPELAKISYNGVTGTIEFDAKGDLRDGYATVFSYRNGQRRKLGVIN